MKSLFIPWILTVLTKRITFFLRQGANIFLLLQHYGVISAISKRGVAAISDAAKKNLEEKFKSLLEAGAPVLGM